MIISPLEYLPVSAFFLAIAILMLTSCEVGYRLGKATRTRVDNDAPASIVSIAGGLLAMLAFVLAFTFSIAVSHHDQRKARVLDEANAIGTAYLRADLLGQADGEQVRRLLQEYVDVRLQGATGVNLRGLIARSVEIHGQLWQQVTSAAKRDPDTNTMLVVESINNVIDMHTKRVTAGLYNRIPASVWLALVAISTFSMITIGVQIGFSGKRRWIAVIPLSLAFAVLVALAVDLDHPQGGLIRVGQQAMIELQKTMSGGDVPVK